MWKERKLEKPKNAFRRFKENWKSRKMPLEDLKKHLLLDAFESSSHSNQIQ
jgi:hypothetical protein